MFKFPAPMLQGLFDQKPTAPVAPSPNTYQDPKPQGDMNRAAKLQTFISDLRRQGKSDREIALLLRQLESVEAAEEQRRMRQSDSGKMI